MKTILIFFILVILSVAALTLLPKEEIVVLSFDDCVAAGNPVMESYPRQCRTPEGQNFVEDIGNELEKIDLIRVSNPRPSQIIESPLLISGQARGFWFFEADFPIFLLDENENEIAVAIASARGNWMTEEFVPFEAVLEFNTLDVQKGVLVFQKDNPSDLPEKDDELFMPVRFENTSDAQIESGIAGTITLGPTCPVFREGMEEQCADKEYQAEVVVRDAEGEREITRFSSNENGVFRIRLSPGTYVLDPLEPEGRQLPYAGNQTVVVKKEAFTDITISYDSGIR